MERLRQAAVLAEFVDKLHKKKIWCNEAYLQKAVYLLQGMMKLPLGFKFFLYMYGPFSSDLGTEFASLRADGILSRELNGDYPGLVPTQRLAFFHRNFSKTLERHGSSLDFFVTSVAKLTPSELERIATSLYVKREQPRASESDQISRIQEIRPLSYHEAEEAFKKLSQLEGKVKRYLKTSSVLH